MSWVLLLLGCESWYYRPKNIPPPRVYTEQDRIMMFEPRWLVTQMHERELVIPVGCLRDDRRDRPVAQTNILAGQSPQSAWEYLVYPEKIYIDKSSADGPLVVDMRPGEKAGELMMQAWKLLTIDGDPYGEDRSFKLQDTKKGDMDVRVKWIDRRRGVATFIGGPFGEGITVVEGNMASSFPAVSVTCDGKVTGPLDLSQPIALPTPAPTPAPEADVAGKDKKKTKKKAKKK